MSSLLSLLRAGDELLSRVVRAICVVAMASIFIMFILNVFVRFVPIYNFTQTDDWIQFALVWMIFLGAQELVRTRNHFVVDLFTDRLRDRLSGRILCVIVCAIELATYAVICWYGWIWVMRSNATMQSIPWLEIRYVYLALPVSAFFMTVFSLKDLVETVTGWSAKDDEDEDGEEGGGLDGRGALEEGAAKRG